MHCSCSNTRHDTLRWLTRLENALKNPATRKKIDYLCGSIEAFLENPSMLNEFQGNLNFKWMRTVTPEEAQNCLARMSVWAKLNKKSKKTTGMVNHKNTFGERVYKPLQKWEVGFGREPGLELALTPWCAQYMWGVDAYFPCCPQDFGTDPLDEYFQNLKVGAVLAYNDYDDIGLKLTVIESEILRSKSSILVMCEKADCKRLIIGIELDEKSKHFIHFILSSYSSKGEADKAFLKKKEFKNFCSAGYSGFAKLYDHT